MKKDITSRKDIELIISKFYKKLLADKDMLPFFEEIVKSNHLEAHIDTITNFWEDILLYTSNYSSNVMQKHLDFDKKVKFTKEHFSIWVNYLSVTIHDNYEGQNAQNMKDRASSIAMVMQVKFKLYD
mgnify:FL=1